MARKRQHNQEPSEAFPRSKYWQFAKMNEGREYAVLPSAKMMRSRNAGKA